MIDSDEIIDRRETILCLRVKYGVMQRQNALSKSELKGWLNGMWEAIETVSKMESVRLEENVGTWRKGKTGVYCTHCGLHAREKLVGEDGNFSFEPDLTPFCPYCGADLRGKHDMEEVE